MTTLSNMIFYGTLIAILAFLIVNCVLACVKILRPLPIREDEDEVDFQGSERIPAELLNNASAHITRESLREQTPDEDGYNQIDMYNIMSSSESLTSSEQGYTTDDSAGSKTCGDSSGEEADEAGTSRSQDDSGIKSNVGDEKQVKGDEKINDN